MVLQDTVHLVNNFTYTNNEQYILTKQYLFLKHVFDKVITLYVAYILISVENILKHILKMFIVF